MKKFGNSNYNIANFVSNFNLGIIRNVRSVKINKTNIGLRLIHVLYLSGVVRYYTVEYDFIVVYFKFYKGRHIVTKLSTISRPGLRSR